MKEEFTGEKYYITDNDELYIEQVRKGKHWGWFFWYGDQFNMCVREPPKHKNLKEVTKKEFDRLYFVEKL